MPQQALDVVSLDDERTQFESAAAVGANLNVNLERSFHKLRVRAIDRAMRGRPLAMRMRRWGLGLRRRRWRNDERTQLGGGTEYASVMDQVKPWRRN